MTDLDQLLNFDPLDTAEKITGCSTNGDSSFDNPALALGFLLVQSHSRKKEQALLAANDTTLNNDLARYRTVIESYGFEEVMADKWHSNWGQDETFFVFAHRKGLLLAFDTFNGISVNGGHVYYNWKCTKDRYGCTGSGGLSQSHDGVWVGNHDCREALIHKLRKMENNGEFLAKWVERPFLWLLHFDDSKVEGYDYEAITQARIDRLPPWVVDMVTPGAAA